LFNLPIPLRFAFGIGVSTINTIENLWKAIVEIIQNSGGIL
jgi:hypothetical protein